VGSSATQLGIWEPQKGYYFIDDDEYSYYAPEGESTPTNGSPLNLDWGYLDAFFPTLVLPSTYVMSDIEVSNVVTWLNGGLRNLIAMDGSIAMKNETGATDLGRIEDLFGVSPAVGSISGLNKVTVGADGHYVTLDYDADDQVGVAGNAKPWTVVTTNAVALGTEDNGSISAPALIVNRYGNDLSNTPRKVCCFNFGVDTGGQLTNNFSQIAQRVFQWARGEAYKVRLELKYQDPSGNADLDITLQSIDGWILTGTGTNTLIMDIPTDGIMTGTNLYWDMYVYPWDAEKPWESHGGFYGSGNDSGGGIHVSLAGKGLQILGITETVYAGRDWDLWVAYNTCGETNLATYGIKDKGGLTDEDNFDDGDTAGWTETANANISWSVSNGKLRATVVGSIGYAYMNRTGLNVSNRNITIECDILFTNGAVYGGLMYRGVFLDVNPTQCGWRDNDAGFFAGITAGVWHHVILNVRDGAPYLASDLYVDNVPVFVNEPIEKNSFASSTAGFVSPYQSGYVEYDNFRVVDEAYSLIYESISGEHVPTNENDVTFWPSLPDYDPDMWEHEGTTMGGQYEWYVYLRGEGVHSRFEGNVYFSPRLMVEDAAFPTNMNPGDTVSLPIEWEALGSNVPAKLRVKLEDPYTGQMYVDAVFMVTNTDGSAYFSVTVPTNIPVSADYLWVTYLYPTNAADSFAERIGLDDTFRFDKSGLPIGPETTIEVPPPQGSDFVVFSDAGIPPQSDLYSWGGSVDANYTILPPPEGTESCYALDVIDWIGWGIFKVSGTQDLSAYSSGYLKFWLWSFEALKVEIKDSNGTVGTVSVGSTGGTWQEISIPLSSFGAVDLSNIYGFFMITSYDAAEYLVDYVRWTMP